jgi:HNH endonuclease/AP2 domain
MLTQEILKENFRYDPDSGDFFWIKQTKFNNRDLTKPISCTDRYGYISVCTNLSGKVKNYRVHRLIWVYVYGEINNEIDHINGTRNDNRLCNLRQVTHQQNMMNKPSKGIYLSTNKKKWVAEIYCKSQRKYLGIFNTPEEATQAYKNATKEIFEEFART